MFSASLNEELIRKNLIEMDLVECIVNLPDKVFTSTPIGACIWVLNKSKKNKGEILFIDASRLAEQISRTLNVIPQNVIEKISYTYTSWIQDRKSFSSENGFSNHANLNEVRGNEYSLFPSAYLKYSEDKNQYDTMAHDVDNLLGMASEAQHYLSTIKKSISMLEEMLNSKNITYATYRLSEILERSTERLGERPEPEVLTCTETAGLVFQRDRFAKRVATENTEKYKYVRSGDIVYNPYLLWAGSIDQCWIVEEGVTSPAYEVFHVRDGFDKTLIGILLKSELMLNKYDGISVGTVKRRRRAPAEKFLELEMTVPVLELGEDFSYSTQDAIRGLGTLSRSTKELLEKMFLSL